MPEDLYTELAHIQGLELGPALERLDNRRDIYEKSLRILLDNLPGLLARLPAELEAGDIRSFAVDLHGLKGSLYSIGAQAAGNHALELEKRAGDDAAFCAEQLRELTGEVQGLADALGVCLKGRGTAAIFTAPSARVLVVDDMPSNIVVVEGLIAPCQMKVDHCSSGEEALRMVKAQEYDLIFMDHLMPGMDGIEATVAIRAMEGERFKTLPIVALTANAMAGMKQVFLDSGFNDYLAKPVEAQKLNAMLWKWIPEEKRESLLDKPRPSGYSL